MVMIPAETLKMTELEHAARLAAVQAENGQLRAVLKECADDLEALVEHHYNKTKDHPAMKRRYDRDIAPVLAARKLLD